MQDRPQTPDQPDQSDQSDQQMLARCQRRLRQVLPPSCPDTLDELRLQMQTVRGRDIEVQISDPPGIAGSPPQGCGAPPDLPWQAGPPTT